MSNRRAIFWLLAGLVIVLLAHVVLNLRAADSARLLRRQVLVPGADAAKEVALSCGTGDVAVVLRQTGTSWRLAQPFAASADGRLVRRLLDTLAFSPLTDSFSDAELLRIGRTRADLGLEPPAATIALSGETVTLGDLTPGRDGVYASVGRAGFVCVAPTNLLAFARLGPNGFRRRSLFTVSADQVRAIDIRGGELPPLGLVRAEAGWALATGEGAAGAKADALLSALLAAEAQSFVWPVGAPDEEQTASVAALAGYGLDPETAVTATLHLLDGSDRAVALGKATAGGVYALAQKAGAVVIVDAALADLVRAPAAAYADTRLFPDAAQAVSVAVSDGDVKYLLARGDDGAWRLDAPVAAPVDAVQVEALVKRLSEVRSQDADPDGLVVALGTNAAPVSVSRSAVLGVVRLEDLRAKEILDIPAADVRRIAVSRPGRAAGPSVVFDPERRTWNVEDGDGRQTVDETAVAGLLGAIAPLRAVRVVKLKVSVAELGAYGLDTPRLTVAVDRDGPAGPVRRNILLGTDAEGGAYATVGASDAVFLIPSETVARLEAVLLK